MDCTAGLGGHARAVLDAGATRLIGLDRDPAAVARAREALAPFGARAEVVHADYRQLGDVLDARHVPKVDGVLVDLGVSSMQFDAPGRGFSFSARRGAGHADGHVERRHGGRDAGRRSTNRRWPTSSTTSGKSATRGASRARSSRRGPLAPVDTTARLADVVRRAVPRRGYTRIDPATRTFQAIRIWVNRELDGLDTFLRDAAHRLAEGGRIAVISFHSLEDRIVKHTFRALQAGPSPLLRVLTKRPLVPTDAEVDHNPRARSAKLRAAEAV